MSESLTFTLVTLRNRTNSTHAQVNDKISGYLVFCPLAGNLRIKTVASHHYIDRCNVPTKLGLSQGETDREFVCTNKQSDSGQLKCFQMNKP